MDEKRFVELLELNNTKLLGEINKKFEQVDKRFEIMDKRIDELDKKFEERFKIMDKRIDELDKKFEERFKKIDEKIIDNNFYFEENYGRKIDIIFEKLQLEDEKNDVKIKEFDDFKKQNNAKLLSHDIRITNLENVVNSN